MTTATNSMLSVAKPLRVLLIGGALLGVVGVVSGLAELKLLSDMGAGAFASEAEMMAAANANDMRQQFIGWSQLALVIVTIIVFAVWIYRANVSVRAQGAEGLRYSPRSAVAWFFVPIAYLWKPYQAMSDLWRASKDPARWGEVQRGSILPLWWTFWLISGFLDQAAFRLSMKADTLGQIQAAGSLLVASDVVDIITAFLAYKLVSEITSMQQARG